MFQLHVLDKTLGNVTWTEGAIILSDTFIYWELLRWKLAVENKVTFLENIDLMMNQMQPQIRAMTKLF